MIVFTLLGLVNAQWAAAQTVTISPTTGNLIAALTGDYGGGTIEVGFENGWSAMWRHEQLPLTLTVADRGTLTPGGELDFPAGNISKYNDNLVLMGGQSADLYMEVSLPKGYRFTGYKLVLLDNLNGRNVNNMSISNGVSKRMYETGPDFNTGSSLASSPVMYGSNSATEYTISRYSSSETDMGHQLYFRMSHGTTAYYGVTVKSFEIEFSAEGRFTETVAPVTPVAVGEGAVSFVGVPYATSKLDIGEIKPNYKNGATYYSYDYRNVKDLTASLLLFQEDAIDSENKAADVAAAKNITSVYNDGNLYYGLKDGVYYVETPTTATSQNGSDLLVGYRITDATINYFWGAETSATTVLQETTETKTQTKTTYRISANTGGLGGTTYYLDTFGGKTTNQAAQGEFFIDDDGYMRLVSNTNAYISYYSSSGNYIVTTTTSRSSAVKVRYQNNAVQAQIGGTWYSLRLVSLGSGGWGSTATYYFLFSNRNYTTASATTSTKSIDVDYPTTVSVNVPAFTPAPYTVRFYDMKGNHIEDKDITVNSESGSGSVRLSDLIGEDERFNNDAVKFEIAGIEGDGQALITIDVTMESLNPYIKSIDIVCHDYEFIDHMTQTFTANDFAVRGGKFTFYVASDFSADENGQRECQFTFEDLYSNYGDKTYYPGTPKQTDGNARYVFVQSPYDQQFAGLYADTYNPDAVFDNPSKVQAVVSGTEKFRFNNADELGNSSTSTETRFYEEYAFNKTVYGLDKFQELYLKATPDEEDNHGIRYLFTADETRYNISPATATEHRMYAYYVMDIQLVVKEYLPTYVWQEVYSETCFSDKGEVVNKPYYGLRLGTTESNEGHMGYLTVDQIEQILAGEKNDQVDYTVNRPAGLKDPSQVLYIDASDLLTIVYRKTTGQEGVDELDQVINSLADNALVYLPVDLTPEKNNFASKTESGGFVACSNIVLTDQRPFYAPIDIQVSGANKVAEYKRTLTPAYGTNITKATMVLPFTINIENGVHSNNDKSGSFEVYQMDAANCLSADADDVLSQNADMVDKANAHFVLAEGSATVANKPYMVKVTAPSGEDEVPFIVKAVGAKVVATPSALTGETASGTIAGIGYTFVGNGTFSGVTLRQADTPNIFYFAKNALYNIQSLRADLDLYVQPFRAYYSYANGGAGGAKPINLLEIAFGPNEQPSSGPTGISTADSLPDLAVTSGRGTITVASREKNVVTIASLDGMQVDRVVLGAGECKTVSVPAGLYVVNGVKIIVK